MFTGRGDFASLFYRKRGHIMSGHSKWSSIKHKKGAKDAKRGKLFTKLIKEITVAARAGGGDVKGNPRLRTAVATAKANSMPNDNIDRAIKKGTGELEGAAYEEIQYEGYGPGGTAILVQVLTDNKNRTVQEIRHTFQRYGGNLGENGCVAWMFDKKGLITVEKTQIEEDRLIGLALDAGAEDVRAEDEIFEITTKPEDFARLSGRALDAAAEDVRDEDEIFEITTKPEDFEKVRETLEREKIVMASGQVSMIPKNTVTVDEKHAEQILKLTEELEDHDDVQSVAANFNIPTEFLEKAS